MKLENVLARETPVAPATSADAHPAYRPDIDGLRALAVLSVVLFHAFPSRLRGGFAGVDIFFIISGYLIGSILIKGMQQGSFSFADFYARRVRRIFPALAVVLAAVLAFGWFALFPDEFKKLGRHVFGGTAFISNFLLWDEVGYFDTAAETKPLLHLWSLGIEEQFYIFWPLLLALAWRLRWNMLAMALALGVASFAVNVLGVHKFPSATFYSPASRVWELLMGASLAYVSVNQLRPFVGVRRPHGVSQFEFDSLRLRHAASLAGLALLAMAVLLTTRERAFPGWWALLPTSGALLLIAAGPRAVVNRHILSNRVMVWVGLVSYPLYLWHWPLLSYAQIIESGLPSSKIRGAAVLAAVALAAATYRLVEKPLRGATRGRAKVIGLALAMSVLALAGIGIYCAQGLPQRASVVENAAFQKDLLVVEDRANAMACKARFGFAAEAQYCLLDDIKRDPTVVVLGDSHAYHIIAGQTRYWRARGENTMHLGTRVPYLGWPVGDDPYQQATPRMLDIAMHTPSVKVIVISTFAKLHLLNDDGKQNTKMLRETVRQMLAAGKQVILVKDIPQIDFEPRACIRRAGVASSQTRSDCSIPAENWRKQAALNDEAVASVLKDFPQVKLFNAGAQLCDAERCHVMLDGILMYRDTHHLSYRGDLWMGERFSRFMEAQARP
jgi:peptidoglycan/LPS O-acetylase OafA/YrhL